MTLRTARLVRVAPHPRRGSRVERGFDGQIYLDHGRFPVVPYRHPSAQRDDAVGGCGEVRDGTRQDPTTLGR